MKRIAIVGLMLVSIVMLTGCSDLNKVFSDVKTMIDVRNELSSYIDQRNPLVDKYNVILEEHDTGFIMEEDYDKSLVSLKESIKDTKDLIKEAENLQLQAEEVKAAHRLFLNGIKYQLKSLEQYEKWMVEENDEFLQSGDEAIDLMNEEMTKHEDALVALAKEYHIFLMLE